MYAVLYAFLLWHPHWENGELLVHCDNDAVVDAINKRSIRFLVLRSPLYKPSCSSQRYSTSQYLLSGYPQPLTLPLTLSPVTISKDLLIWGTKITITTTFATLNHKPQSQSYARSYSPSAQTPRFMSRRHPYRPPQSTHRIFTNL
jgi:hypothetical protein